MKMEQAFHKRDRTTGETTETAKSRDGETRSDLLVPAFTSRQRLTHWLFLGGWAAALTVLWSWWLQPGHRLDTFWFVVNSAVLAWVTLMPAYLLFVLGRGRIPNPAISLPTGRRVAMVVTKVPAEPWPMVQYTLLAMLRQPYPHDTWLADEDPSPETSAWCAANGVSISTRRDCAAYHRPEWPRRRRCKEGNLAYFYDHYGYSQYDFVVQLDADHVPAPTYLEEMLRPFVDTKVGYVSAPSICSRNAAESWSARSRLYAEGMLHGGLQVGYTGGLAPLCFGSHYAVRTKALQEIGGLGPELAEDHTTTLLMNASGWRGVHAVNAIAHGDGPETFADLATQEFQWSRSLTTILLRYSPRYLGMLPGRLKVQFLFSQSWYALFSIMMAISYALPLIAIANNRSMVNVTYPEFFIRFQLVTAILMAMGFWWHGNGWARPQNAKAFSWEGAVFLMARWPWSLLGVAAGAVNVLFGKEANFRITPKGSGARANVPFQVLLPYLLLSLGSSGCVLLTNSAAVHGYYVFAGINAIFYAVVLATILMMHLVEAKPRTEEVPRRRVFAPLQFRNCIQALAAVAVLIFGLGGIVKRGPQGAEFLLAGADSIPSASDRVIENAAGDKKRFIDGTTKLDAADIADIFGSHFAEANLGTPVTPPEVPGISDLEGAPQPSTDFQASLDVPRSKGTDQQFRSASLRWPHRQTVRHRSHRRAARPAIARIAANAAARGGVYAHQILSVFGSLIFATHPVRSADRVNAKR
jgi:cellulose synthase (UDP-forming)